MSNSDCIDSSEDARVVILFVLVESATRLQHSELQIHNEVRAFAELFDRAYERISST